MVLLTSLFAGVLGGVPSCCVVESNVLQDCSSCTSSSLSIASSGITSIDASAFDSLTSLTHLDLNDNDALTSLPEGVFDSLTSLTDLDLDGNDALTSLPVGFRG